MLSGSLTRPSSASWMAFCGLSVASSMTVGFLVSTRNLLCGLRSCKASVSSARFSSSVCAAARVASVYSE